MSLDPNRPIVPEPFNPTPPESLSASSIPTAPVAPSPVTAAPAIVPAARKTSGGGRWLNVVLVVAAAVAIGGVAFAVGRTTAPVSATTGNGRGTLGGVFPGGSFAPRASGAPGLGRGGFGGGFGGGLTVSGTVESVNGDTLTIKTANGQTIEVTTGPSTTYNTQSAASASDVQAGKTVQVQLDLAGGAGLGRPNASGAPGGTTGTASSVTVVP